MTLVQRETIGVSEVLIKERQAVLTSIVDIVTGKKVGSPLSGNYGTFLPDGFVRVKSNALDGSMREYNWAEVSVIASGQGDMARHRVGLPLDTYLTPETLLIDGKPLKDLAVANLEIIEEDLLRAFSNPEMPDETKMTYQTQAKHLAFQDISRFERTITMVSKATNLAQAISQGTREVALLAGKITLAEQRYQQDFTPGNPLLPAFRELVHIAQNASIADRTLRRT